MVLMVVGPAGAAAGGSGPDPVRFSTFNASLNRFSQGDLRAELEAAVAGAPTSQLSAVLEIIAINDPDVLLINEFDYDPEAGALFAMLAGYGYHFIAPSNTGVPSGADLDNSGSVGGPNDAFGFGFFPGQFGMLVLSKYPIGDVRTFQNFLWKDMPGALLPELDGVSWYSDEELDIVRLSSKSHWDVSIEIGRKVVHFLVSHPTPPVFDGPEDRNGTRNSDEIRFWADYIIPSQSGYIYDDAGTTGGLTPGAFFVIAGDQNSDPLDGDSIPGSAQQLLDHPRVNAKVTPSSEGAVEASALQGGANDAHLSDPAFDTADFSDSAPGNLRADYVLPSKALRITDAAVFWPVQADPLFDLVGVFPFPSSDHRLVWVDVNVPGR
ncbi:MAG: endonuclease/exonuclease/phosphatase family protein [Acidimicrobiia bacterium]|nr:endonuclease/exonuclease/phosphatase family protein [Acidimicrobiia bacterium]MDH4306690.1 endonuclease/exonuclease/phosphatase family protein [Acidimicrobiia bacterium]MDH5292563.1 endonuclease/exonuclease/phosphatase family protein [Acidimicrobiia bacterium]